MSTDWNVHCLDCADTHGFNDANWCDADMAVICKHAAAIANLAPLLSETTMMITLHTAYGRIEPSWFAKHAGHRLVPINEYGHFMEQCAEYVTCACGSNQRCGLKVGHNGDHDPKHRSGDFAAG